MEAVRGSKFIEYAVNTSKNQKDTLQSGAL